MHIKLTRGDIATASVDAVIVNLFQGVKQPAGAIGAVDEQIGGLIAGLAASGELKGKLNETTVIPVAGKPFRKVVVVGLGKQDEFTAERARQAAASALKAANKGDTKTVATIVHGAGIGGLDPSTAAQSLAEGTLLGGYRYDKYKSKTDDDNDTDDGVKTVHVYEQDENKATDFEAGIARGTVLADATIFARDLVNAPGNELTPTVLAERARSMAQDVGLECDILDKEEMEKLGMGALLGVAQGSAQEPKLVFMRYRGSDDEQPIALVGKGVTFDTGGISLKPGAGMAAMTGDMAGSAAVFGAMYAIAKLQPKQHVICVAACVENMPSGTALKPGDIVRAMTGKTIEIDNTDAEGRLILADAVAYAESKGAHTIVDVATLTGACVIALGGLYTGLVSTDDELADELIAAGEKAGERYTRLPADPEFKQQYKSHIADIKNTGGRPAGTITGALIIGEFVDKARWAHFDIAGTGSTSKPRHYFTEGGTGTGVRTLAEYVCAL